MNARGSREQPSGHSQPLSGHTRVLPSASASPGAAPSPPNWRLFGTLMAGVWALFLLAPVTAILQEPSLGAMRQAVSLALIAVFASLYCVGFYRWGTECSSIRAKLAVLAALFLPFLAICALAWPIGMALSPYLIAYVSFAMPLQVSSILAPVLVAAVLVTVSTAIDGDYSSLSVIAVILALAGIAMNLFLGNAKRTEELERRQLVLLERERLGRDVHDLLGHSLTVLGLKTQLVEKLLETDPPRARAELASMRAITAEALAGVKQTVHDQRPTALTTELSVATSSLRSAGIEVDVNGEAARLPAEHGPELAWIVREASTNILRHAQAQRVRITLDSERLVIEDDGVGVETRVGEACTGNGLQGIHERAGRIRARASISPLPRGGTSVEVAW